MTEREKWERFADALGLRIKDPKMLHNPGSAWAPTIGEDARDRILALLDVVARVKHHAVPVPVREIVRALEREAANTDTDGRWLAAAELRRMANWEDRTLMCEIDQRPSETVAVIKR